MAADDKRLKILFIAAEVTPLAKVGGLGDVAGSLPKSLRRLGVDIRIALPLYGSIDRKKYGLKPLKKNISLENGGEKINLWQAVLPGSRVIVYFIEHRLFAAKDIYPASETTEYKTSLGGAVKFIFFSRALLVALKSLDFPPDVIHINDWHMAALIDFLRSTYRQDSFFKKTKILYTIHNLANQGKASPRIIGFSKLDPDLPIIRADLKNGDINFMVQGILGADLINTVSPTYAKEILTHYQGAGLDNVLKKRRRDLYGILNGIDTELFNPAADKFIKQNYSAKTVAQKINNKIFLQKKLGWHPDKNTALVGLVSRLVWQKGVELITEKFKELPCQFVFLGAGQKNFENHLLILAKKHPNKFKALIKFDAALAQQIYAGADIFLMPSRFEPCGLSQLIAMRYGTVPVVRTTGGLADTVDKTVGFSFGPYKTEALYQALEQALYIYRRRAKEWRRLQLNGMKRDFSWNKSAKEYLKLYQKLANLT